MSELPDSELVVWVTLRLLGYSKTVTPQIGGGYVVSLEPTKGDMTQSVFRGRGANPEEAFSAALRDAETGA